MFKVSVRVLLALFFVFIKFLVALRAKKKCLITCFILPGDERFFLSPVLVIVLLFKLTDFLVEDFVKCQFVSLLQILLHHAANAANMGGEENWINSHHCYQITEADATWTSEAQGCFSPPCLCLLSWPWFGPLLTTCPQAVKLQGGQSTREAAREPGEKHATLGTSDNENETGESKSICTPHTGLLRLQQHQPFTRGQRPGFTCKSSCRTQPVHYTCVQEESILYIWCSLARLYMRENMSMLYRWH